MSDIRWSYSRSLVLAELLDPRGVKHVFIRSGCPWRNGKWNGLTGLCKPSGPTGSPSEAIKNTLTCLPLGFATITMNATTSPSEATSPSVNCYQPDGRVQLVLGQVCQCRVLRTPRRRWLLPVAVCVSVGGDAKCLLVSLREEGAADARGVVDWVCLRVDLDGQCVEDEPVDKVVQGSDRVGSAREATVLVEGHVLCEALA